MKKSISWLLAFSLLLLAGNAFGREKSGAQLIVEKLDGLSIHGELIAVKQTSLLLKKRGSTQDTTVEISEIKSVKIRQKTRADIGFLAGAALGAVVGFAQGDDRPSRSHTGVATNPISFDLKLSAGTKAIIFGLGGGILGALIGGTSNREKKYFFKGMPEKTKDAYLNELRKKARIKSFQ